MNVRTLLIVASCGIFACFSNSFGYENPALFWELPAGKKFDVSSEEVRQVFTSVKEDSEQTAETTWLIEQSWEVKSASDGVAAIDASINRVQFKVELIENSLRKEACRFDTQTAKKTDDSLLSFGLHPYEQGVLMELVGKPFRLTMKSSGKINSISLPNGTALDKVARDNWKNLLESQRVRTSYDESGRLVKTPFTIEMLREELFAETLPLVFFMKRSGPILPSDLDDSLHWTQTSTVNFIDPTLKALFSFRRSYEPKARNRAMKTFDLKIQPKANPYTYIEQLGSDEYLRGTGQLTWDLKNGHISEYKVVEMIKSTDTFSDDPAKLNVRTTKISFSKHPNK